MFTRQMVCFGIATIVVALLTAVPCISEEVNLIQNGGFEKLANGMPEGWSLWSQKTADVSIIEKGHRGNSIQMTRDTFDNCYLAQTINLKDLKGQAVVLGAVVKIENSGEFEYPYSGAKLIILFINGGTALEATIREDQDWERVTLDPWVIPDVADSVNILVGVHSAKGTFSFDDVTLTPVTLEEAKRIKEQKTEE